MSTRAVAVEQEVLATPGTLPYVGAASGTWTAGPVAYTSYSLFKVGGVPVIDSARCTFVFSGTTGGGNPIAGTETVTLRAAATPVQRSARAVLLDQDSAVGQFGNTLRVQARGRMRSG